MKKLTALTLAVLMLVTCSLCLFSCGDNMTAKIAGTYSMTAISGTITAGGQTIELGTDLYDRYDIVLNKDGTAKIISAGKGSLEIEQAATWKYEGGKLKVISETAGVKVTEAMDWKDNVITYETKQSTTDMEISMKITLTKK